MITRVQPSMHQRYPLTQNSQAKYRLQNQAHSSQLLPPAERFGMRRPPLLAALALAAGLVLSGRTVSAQPPVVPAPQTIAAAAAGSPQPMNSVQVFAQKFDPLFKSTVRYSTVQVNSTLWEDQAKPYTSAGIVISGIGDDNAYKALVGYPAAQPIVNHLFLSRLAPYAPGPTGAARVNEPATVNPGASKTYGYALVTATRQNPEAASPIPAVLDHKPVQAAELLALPISTEAGGPFSDYIVLEAYESPVDGRVGVRPLSKDGGPMPNLKGMIPASGMPVYRITTDAQGNQIAAVVGFLVPDIVTGDAEFRTVEEALAFLGTQKQHAETVD